MRTTILTSQIIINNRILIILIIEEYNIIIRTIMINNIKVLYLKEKIENTFLSWMTKLNNTIKKSEIQMKITIFYINIKIKIFIVN